MRDQNLMFWKGSVSEMKFRKNGMTSKSTAFAQNVSINIDRENQVSRLCGALSRETH
jgi:hypothetical protein